MSDIVERLRSGEDGLEYAAADEIERLSMDRDVWRNESIKKQAACEQMGARITALEAERDAYRAQAERWDTEAAASKAALALYRAENGCTRGQRTTQWCGEATRLRRAWLRVIQQENQCPASGGGCLAKRCGCVAEMEMLIEEGARP